MWRHFFRLVPIAIGIGALLALLIFLWEGR